MENPLLKRTSTYQKIILRWLLDYEKVSMETLTPANVLNSACPEELLLPYLRECPGWEKVCNTNEEKSSNKVV